MCECSKRHRNTNGPQLLHQPAEGGGGPAVQGYIKHILRHHRGRGGSSTAVTKTPAVLAQKREVSLSS